MLEIVASGVPQEKVVIGKPGTPVDAGAPSPSGGGGTQEASGGGTDVAGGGGTQVASGGTQEASGGTQEASGGTLEASGGNGTRRRQRRQSSNSSQDPNINGFLETQTLAQCLVQAKDKGWNAGVMVWEVRCPFVRPMEPDSFRMVY